jgi:phosphoribosylformylglycinamidine synthase
MTAYRVEVRVMPRAALLDPQGQAVEHALHALGFKDVARVRVGKHLVLDLDAASSEAAAASARDVRPAARQPGHRRFRCRREGRLMRRVAVVVFPGSNCDVDTIAAARDAGSDAYPVWHRDTDLRQPDVVILPGGFSYGDYLRSGAIARFSPVMEDVAAFAQKGAPVVGICNGFQILTEAGLLPLGAMRTRGSAFSRALCGCASTRVDTPSPICMTRARSSKSHRAGDGRFVADPRTTAELEAQDQVVWRYVRDNPNGSTNDIAGICNAGRNVVGIMPHPERRTAPALGGDDGARVFQSMEAGNATQHAVDVRAVGDHHLRV